MHSPPASRMGYQCVCAVAPWPGPPEIVEHTTQCSYHQVQRGHPQATQAATSSTRNLTPMPEIWTVRRMHNRPTFCVLLHEESHHIHRCGREQQCLTVLTAPAISTKNLTPLSASCRATAAEPAAPSNGPCTSACAPDGRAGHHSKHDAT
jgi:hypothetical protein